MPSNTVVKRGKFLYGGASEVRVEIVQTDFRPGTGDVYEEEEFREDKTGIFYEVRYIPLFGKPFDTRGGYFDTVTEAIKSVESSAQGVTWE